MIDFSLGKSSADFIEARNDRGLVDRKEVIGSFLADVSLLSGADGLVATAASWTSRVALLAIIGESGRIPPFVMVDRPIGQLWFASRVK